MAHYYCLLMDLDGTLLDFDLSEQMALEATLAHYAFQDPASAAAQYRAINNALWEEHTKGKMPQEKLVSERFLRLLTACGMHGDAKQMNEFYLTQLAAQAHVIPGADEALKELCEVATIAAVTNGIEFVQANRLHGSGLADYFDVVFVSSRVGAAKPSRKIFDIALQTLGVENRDKVLVIGDSLSSDIQGGVNAGLATCWMNYKDEPLPEGAPQPTHIVRGFEELLRVVMEEEELSHVGMREKRHLV